MKTENFEYYFIDKEKYKKDKRIFLNFENIEKIESIKIIDECLNTFIYMKSNYNNVNIYEPVEIKIPNDKIMVVGHYK